VQKESIILIQDIMVDSTSIYKIIITIIPTIMIDMRHHHIIYYDDDK